MYQTDQCPNQLNSRQANFYYLLIFGLVLLSMFPVNEIKAQGNLLIMPRRVVFEGSKKSQELTLANTGGDTAKYVVAFVQMRMKQDGSFEQITTPDSGQLFADKYLRFFPRTVTLPPNQTQVVKMQVNKSAKMAPGEYRSHVFFKAIPKEVPLGEEASKKDSNALAVRMVPVFGITIPAIIRVGDCSAKLSMTDIAVEMYNDTVPRLQMNFIRSGNSSVYGDITVMHTSPEGVVTKVAVVNGVAVYTPNVMRKFACNLDKTHGIDYRKGKLKIRFSTPEDIKATIIAEAELLLH
jgi:hypothetical protein